MTDREYIRRYTDAAERVQRDNPGGEMGDPMRKCGATFKKGDRVRLAKTWKRRALKILPADVANTFRQLDGTGVVQSDHPLSPPSDPRVVVKFPRYKHLMECRPKDIEKV